MQNDFHRARPRPVAAVMALLLLLAPLHLGILLAKFHRRDELRWEVSHAHPTFDAAVVDASTTIALYAATGFHVVMALASCALATRIRPRRRSRLILTTTLVSMLAAGVTSWQSWQTFHAAVLGVSLVEFSALALIWCRPSARSYFTATTLSGADGISVDTSFGSSTQRRGDETQT